MISFRGDAQKWRIFRMASASRLWLVEMKELRNSTGHQQKHSVIFKKSVLWSQHRWGEFMNERVKVLSQRCCYVSSRFFKWVYGNPWPLLVGIRRIPAYHVDYTTDPTQYLNLTTILLTINKQQINSLLKHNHSYWFVNGQWKLDLKIKWLMVPKRTFNIHATFPFYKRFFIVEKDSLDNSNIPHDK